jgi:hypothetical protein
MSNVKPLIKAANSVVHTSANITKLPVNSAGLSQSTKISIIVGIVIFGLMAILGLISFIMQQTNNGKVKAMEEELNNANTQNINTLNKLNSVSQIQATNMKRGDQGPPGMQGPPGPTGGVHAGAGPLLCVGQRKVATPTVGVSDASIIYLDEKRYTPIQYWTLRNNSDGSVSVVNKFTGNCMTTNNNLNVFSDKCRNPIPSNQKFFWGPNMQLSSVQMQNYCVSVDSKFQMSYNNMNKFNLDNMTEDNSGSNKGNVTKLILEQCAPVQKLNQTWWIGN